MAVEEVTFGLVPHVDDAVTRGAFDELCELLEADTRIKVRPFRAGAPVALAAAIEAGQVQLAWMSPTLLLLSDALENVVPLLSSLRQGVAFFHSVLFVRASSSIETVEQLEGCRVAWVAKTSASGYIVPRLSLARRGLDLTSFFSEETFSSSHGASVWAVHEGRADAGATYAVFEQGDPTRALVKSGIAEFGPAFEGRIIDAAGPIPSDMIVAHPSLPIRTRAQLAGSLSRLAEDMLGGPSIRKLIGADAFRAFDHVALSELQTLVEAARKLSS